jgi:hypothetical protein
MGEWLAWLGQYQAALTLLATVAVAAATVALAALTWALVRENRLLRRAGTDPQIVAYVIPNHLHFNVFDFVISNIGGGAAREIKLTIVKGGDDFEERGVWFSPPPIPFNILPAGESIRTSFGSSLSLFKEPRLKAFAVRMEYKNIRLRKMSPKEFEIDIQQYQRLERVGSPPEKDIVKHLKGIDDGISRLLRERLRVETITAEERERRDKERVEAMRAERERRAKGGAAP